MALLRSSQGSMMFISTAWVLRKRRPEMFWTTLRFELSYQMRRPVTWLYFTLLFLLAFGFMSSEQIGLGVGLVRRNSPFAITQMMLLLVAVGQVITTAIVGTA